MFKKIVRTLIIVLIAMGVLWLGGTSIYKFGHDIGFRRPSEVFEPLISRIGINLNLMEPDNNTGSILVNAEEPTAVPITNQPVHTTQPNITPNIPTETAVPIEIEQNITVEKLNELISTIIISESHNIEYNIFTFEYPVQTYIYEDKTYMRQEYSYLLNLNSEEYICPYTGLKIKDSTKLSYDHIIPIEYIINYGNIDWDNETCNKYSYDITNGICVQNKKKNKKNNRGPADWLPDVNIEDYCYTWLCIASEWGISLRQEDINICKLQCMNAIGSGHILTRLA